MKKSFGMPEQRSTLDGGEIIDSADHTANSHQGTRERGERKAKAPAETVTIQNNPDNHGNDDCGARDQVAKVAVQRQIQDCRQKAYAQGCNHLNGWNHGVSPLPVNKDQICCHALSSFSRSS